MVLAQYTIRSKQEYIFKTNRVLEIIGASAHIAKAWDVLFHCAEEIHLGIQKQNQDFDYEKIRQLFERGRKENAEWDENGKDSTDNTLNVVELFQGGGNETLLFDSIDSYRRLNREFSYRILREYPGMIPMAVFVKASGNYSLDYSELMKASDRKKNIMVPEYSIFTVPFSMMDRTTFQPFSHVINMDRTQLRMSDESFGKYKTGKSLREAHEDIKYFDEMVSHKGKESLLAVVHADGNNMGAKIMEMLHGEKDYSKAVSVMREFTGTTKDCFEDSGKKALEKCQKELLEANKEEIKKGHLKKNSVAFRSIIGSGDDMTFICNARFVMDYVQAYLNSVQNYKKTHQSRWQYSSCAGICIFHSHFPFAKAYSIAEQACDDGAKQKVHVSDAEGKPVPVEEGWIDFHFVHNGISGDLEEIRNRQGTDRCIARPWLVSYDRDDENAEKENFKYEKLIRLKTITDEKKVSRSNIKTIGSAFERSSAAAKKELVHIYGHTPGLKQKLEELFPEEDMRLKALYDLSEIYDLWYGEVK